MRQGVEGAAKRKGVKVVRGEGRVDGDAVVVDGERYPFDHLIVCVGTEPSGLPGFDMEHPAILTSNDILVLESGARVDAGRRRRGVGCEFASLFAPLGTEITIVEILPRLLLGHRQPHRDPVPAPAREGRRGRPPRAPGGRDHGLPRRRRHRAARRRHRGQRREAARVGGPPIAGGGIGLEEIGVEITERGHVVVDEFLRTANPRVWGAGDCIGGLQLAHLASAEAARAVENAVGGEMVPMDRTVVPSCIYTHPEIATVGLNADDAKERGYEVTIGQARFGGSGKALGEGEPDGYAQLVVDSETGLLLGATIMGVHAVEMIHEIGVAIAEGLTASELGEVIHAHPTVSEMVMDAAQQAVGVAPYLS